VCRAVWQMIMINILIWILFVLLLAVVLLLLLLLLIPFEYSISATIKKKANLAVRVRWALFQVALLSGDWRPAFEVSLLGKVIKSGPITKMIGKREEKKEKKKSRLQRPGSAFIKAVLAFMDEVLNVLKPKWFAAFGIYSLDDPADTGVLSGVIALISAFWPSARIHLTPSFESETDVEIESSGRIVLILLVGIMIKYLLKKEVRQVVFR